MENNNNNENLYLYANPLEIVQPTEKPFFTPTALPFNLFNTALTYGHGDIERLPASHALINRHNKYAIEEKTGQYKLIYKNSTATIEIGIKELIGKNNIAARKLLQFISEKVLSDVYSKATGQLTSDFIQFPLSAIYGVNNIFATERSARQGFYTAIDKIRSLSIKGEMESDGITTGIISGGAISKGVCYVELTKMFNWASVGKEYIPTPHYKYALSTTPFDLLTTICNRVRQQTAGISQKYRTHIKNIKDGKKARPITISLKWASVVEALALKPKLRDGKPKDLRADLITPICDAIKILNNMEQQHDESRIFKNIKTDIDILRTPPREILEKGHIIVELTLDYARQLNNIMNYNKNELPIIDEPKAQLEDKQTAADNIENQTSIEDFINQKW